METAIPEPFTSELSWKIFLDRYTLKDIDRRFRVGDLAIVMVEPHPKWPKKDIGVVKAITGEGLLEIELLTGPQKGDVLTQKPIDCDRPLETTLDDVAKRIARGVAAVESDKVRADVEHAFAQEVGSLRFVPGGRIWAGAGTGKQLTFFNCYVIPNPRDSREGIVETLGQMIEIMSRGGGVGINVSSLRPSRAAVRGVNGRSSGAVSWMDLYSRATGLVEQGGCFGPDVRIATDRGLIPAAELARRVAAGERVRALTHEGLKPITARFLNGPRQLYEVVTARGYRVEVTAEHKVGVLRHGVLTTVPLAELQGDEPVVELLGDGLPTPPATLVPLAKAAVAVPDRMTADLAYVAGYLHGAGIEPRDARSVVLKVDDRPAGLRDRLTTRLRRLFGEAVHLAPGTGGSLIVLSHPLGQWLARNGLLPARSGGERVPEAIWRSGSALMGAFISGVVDARGIPDDGQDVVVAGLSPDFLRDLQELLAVNGILARLAPTPPLDGEPGPSSVLAVEAGFTARLATLLGDSLTFGREADGTSDPLRRSAAGRAHHAGGREHAVAVLERGAQMIPDRIVSVLPTRVTDTFDFEVADTHMLSAGGLYTSNSRRGALMLQIEDWHPDIWRFIDVKKTPGMVENANISVRISDRFMEAVKADGDWELVFPDTTDPDYDALWDGNLEKWRELGKPVVVYETTKARKIWHEIIKGAWQAAEPGVVFDERHEKESNSWYFNPLVCTNPCVTGDTLVHTARGLRRAEDLYREGSPVRVLVDGRFAAGRIQSASAVFMTGIKQVVRLETEEGFQIRVTPDHRIFSDTRGWVAAGALEIGERIRIGNQGGGFGATGSAAEGWRLGRLYGDRYCVPGGGVPAPAAPGPRRRAGTAFGDDTAPVGLATLVPDAEDAARDPAAVPDAVFTGSRAMQAGFLRALFDTAATVEARLSAVLSLSSRHPKLLRDVQLLLVNFGILSRIAASPEDQAVYGLTVSGISLVRFHDAIGLVSAPKVDILARLAADERAQAGPESWTARVTAILNDGIEPVYDLTEPDTHSFVANGVVVHNCAEQPLPAWGVCTLGHINLAAMYDPATRDVNWDQLRKTIRMGVRFLDDIVDATPYFFPQNLENQKRERRIGMGTLGLGELLIRLGLRYGSPESVTFIDRLYRFIATEAYLYDAELAREKGAFPAFDAEKYLQSGFMQRMPEAVRAAIARHGARNVTILTQAPTGTVGTLVGTSTGIEPFYALTYFRQSRLGFDEQYVPVAQEWMDQHPGERLPDYFVGAMDLTPEEHIYVQAAIQRWTDSSISKTANAPSTYTVEDTARLYELAYDLGCKGVTIYRDKSRTEQVLHLKEDAAELSAEASETPARPAHRDFPPSVEVYPVPAQVAGRTYRKETPAGTARVVINEVDSDPFEVFLLLGRAGSEVQSFMEALGRVISLYLRSSGDLTPRRRLQLVADQLKGIGGAHQMGFGTDRVLSVVDAIGQVLDRHLNPDKPNGPLTAPVPSAEGIPVSSGTRTSAAKLDLCPQCESPTLVYEEGCAHCTACGFSKC